MIPDKIVYIYWVTRVNFVHKQHIIFLLVSGCFFSGKANLFKTDFPVSLS